MNVKTLDHYLNKEEVTAEETQRKALKNLVEIFHENTKITTALKSSLIKTISYHLTNSSQIYLDSRNKKNYVFSSEKKLPQANSYDISFEEILMKRSSKNKFKAKGLTEKEQSNLLSSIRVTRSTPSPINKKAIIHQRTYASAGALYPVEIYSFSPNENYTSWNCFNYNPIKHSKTLVSKNICPKSLSHAFQFESSHMKCGTIIVLTGIFSRSTNKYGAIGYRFSLIEAGGIIQQLGLAGAALNLNTLTWGGALDNEVNKLIGVDGIEENYLISFLAGH